MSNESQDAVAHTANKKMDADVARRLALEGNFPLVDLIQLVEQLTPDEPAAAVQLYRDWIALHPSSPGLYVAHFNLGVLLANLRRDAEAEQAYRAAMARMPNFVQAHLNVGTVLERLDRPEEALDAWRSALALTRPDVAEDKPLQIHALNNLGRLLEIRKDNVGAEQALSRSLALDPKQPQAIAHWVHLRQKLCIWPAFAPFEGASRDDLLDGASALAHLAESEDPALQLAAARRYVEQKVLPLQPALAPSEGYAHRKLRIGYLSGDFCNHPVAILTAELYALHDRERVEVYGFSWSRTDGSPLRARVVDAMDHYIRIDAMSDLEAAQCIREHEIDILVDLHGLTLGTRHDILSWRPAPVQVTWLGFPGPTALPAIDYVIADRYVLPEALQPHFTERALYLPDCFQVNDRRRPIGVRPTRAAAGLPGDAFVFCCFNNTFKIKPEMFGAWMTILQRTPGSVLWLVADDDAVRIRLRAHAAARDVDPERLIFAARVAPENYLARYQLADLFLDTFPFNAGTTASDALWAGLPLLTLSGAAFDARMAGSLLHAVGLPQLITETLPDYVERAVALGTGRHEAAAMKATLEANRATCVLFDSPRLVRALEDKLLEVARRPAPAQRKLALYTIAWSDAVMAQIEPGYGVLDNRRDGRHDWREYWPMRKFLMSEPLDEDTYYGFFSPKFFAKTGLSHAAVSAFVAAAPADTDVFTFSPQPDMGSLFLNVFEQNELFDPGFGAATEAFLAAAGRPVALASLVMDSRQVVFSNFIVARPAFWRAWLGLNERLFALCEGEASPLKAAFTGPTGYPGDVQRKVFLMERIASLLLTIEPRWRVKAYNTFQCAWSATMLGERKLEAVISDALKIAMREQGYGDYRTAFAQIRDRLRKPQS
jgi:predicted O-linked N-acetylglucosamine transferase (SPINDLY family)